MTNRVQSTMNIHSCSYYCDRPECIKEQRDGFVKKLEASLAQSNEEFCDTYCLWSNHHLDCALAKEPLTDQEIIEAIKHISHNEMSAFAIARAIERVLK